MPSWAIVTLGRPSSSVSLAIADSPGRSPVLPLEEWGRDGE